ncbi:hypothetical protein DP73_12785 [Desulfosporosinus sp. HMP52]|nr:hypothetical protein DP73_12785 [Desulfosporosinus sp. HMP52]
MLVAIFNASFLFSSFFTVIQNAVSQGVKQFLQKKMAQRSFPLYHLLFQPRALDYAWAVPTTAQRKRGRIRWY